MKTYLNIFPIFVYSNVLLSSLLVFKLAQSAGAVEYTDCTSAVGGKTPPQRVSWYDTKQSDGEVPVILLPGPLWPGVVAPDRALSMG